MSTALRTSLIWHDEVMADVVHEKPAPVTLGTDSSATFTTPELALPPSFSIVTPGRRGYLLTMSAKMGGTICLGGVEHDVAAYVAANDDGSGFVGTLLGPDDWGVIDLDGGGEHKFFFQFVPHEVEDWNLGHPMILAGVAGYVLSILALTLFWWHDGIALGEAAFRAASLSSLAIGFAAIVRWAFRQNNESRASLAFSVLLHSAILFLTFQLYERESPTIWPGPKSMTGTYLVKASEPPPEPKPERIKTIQETPTEKPAAAIPRAKNDMPIPEATTPWKRKAQPTMKQEVPKAKKKSGKKGAGIMAHTEVLDDVTGDRGLQDAINDMKRIDGDGHGDEPEYGAGDGSDTRGGDPDAKRGNGPVGKAGPKSKKPIDTGGLRAEVCVINCGGGGGGPIGIEGPVDTGGGDVLSKDDIAKVMGANQGLFKYCFQAAIDHGQSGGGDLVLAFTIGTNGRVTSSRTVRGSINPDVAACVKQKLLLLRFPKKGGAIVSSFPFIFSSN